MINSNSKSDSKKNSKKLQEIKWGKIRNEINVKSNLLLYHFNLSINSSNSSLHTSY